MITNIIYIYIFILLSMIIFNILCVYIRKLNDFSIVKKQKKLQLLINNYNEKKLKRKLRHISYLIAFSNCEIDNKEKLTPLFNKLTDIYNKKNIIEKTYFVYVLSKFSLAYKNDNKIINFLINNSFSNSLYLSENCLKALYKLDNPKYIVKTFLKMNYENCNHHYKLLSDGLLNFKGDKKELSYMFLDNYNKFNNNFRLAIINYFIRIDIDLSKEMYKILLEETNKEVKISLLRYFGKHKYDKAKDKLIEFLNDDYEYAIVSIQSLQNYDGLDVVESLKKSLTSSNWYVRNRAARGLINRLSKDEINKLLKIDDKYAIDALNYQIEMRNRNA